MNKAPEISIIIPVYNTEKYLTKCLDTVCKQSLSNIEIICIDDGSTDNSSNIIKEYQSKDQRIKLINQKNCGIAIARKNALKYATGKYIGFVDSDDYIENDFYKKLYNIAIQEKSDIVVSNNYYIFDEKDIKKIDIFYSHKKELLHLDRCKLFLIQTGLWNKIYKKTLVDNIIDFYTDVSVDAEDASFTLFALASAKNVSIIDSANYFYRNLCSSISHKNLTIDECIKIYKIYQDILENLKKVDTLQIPIKLYKKYIIKRRNLHLYKKIIKFQKISTRLFIILKIKDFKFALSWIARFLFKEKSPTGLKKIIENFYYKSLRNHS